jgi:hypothetical protein
MKFDSMDCRFDIFKDPVGDELFNDNVELEPLSLGNIWTLPTKGNWW